MEKFNVDNNSRSGKKRRRKWTFKNRLYRNLIFSL